MKFEIGDVVVMPGTGVGRIEDIVNVDVGSEDVEMYKIALETDEMSVWVPIHREVVDIRPPLDAQSVDRVLEVIRETTAPAKRANWNRRQRRYRELLTSPDPLGMAELLGELASVKQDKALSFGERRLFDKAKKLMEAELQAAAEEPDAVVKSFEDALAA